MLHFRQSEHNKALPQKGDIVWILPIRYWEPDEYGPEKFTVDYSKMGKNGLGQTILIIYGQYEKEKPDTPMYCHAQYESQWYWEEDKCREAQLLLTQLYEVIGMDEASHITDKILGEMKIPGE